MKAVVLGVATAAIGASLATGGAAMTPAGASVVLHQTWSIRLPDTGKPVATSSPTVVTLDGGGPAVVVGDRAGHVYAVHFATVAGSRMAGQHRRGGGRFHALLERVDRIRRRRRRRATRTPAATKSLAANGRRPLVPQHSAAPGGRPRPGVEPRSPSGTSRRNRRGLGTEGQMANALNGATGSVLSGWPLVRGGQQLQHPRPR